LHSAASFNVRKEEPDALDRSRGGEKVIAATEEIIKSIGIGKVSVGQVTLDDVRDVPGLDRNLMSISALDEDDWKLAIEKGGVVVSRAGQSMTVKSCGGVYPVAAAVSVARIDVEKAALSPSSPSARQSLQENGLKRGLSMIEWAI
jgi:hypothetical protein